MRPYRLDGLGHRAFNAATRVRIPLGTPRLYFSPSHTISCSIINFRKILEKHRFAVAFDSYGTM